MLGPHVMVDDQAYVGTEDTPQYDLCEDDSKNVECNYPRVRKPIFEYINITPKKGQGGQRLSSWVQDD